MPHHVDRCHGNGDDRRSPSRDGTQGRRTPGLGTRPQHSCLCHAGDCEHIDITTGRCEGREGAAEGHPATCRLLETQASVNPIDCGCGTGDAHADNIDESGPGNDGYNIASDTHLTIKYY